MHVKIGNHVYFCRAGSTISPGGETLVLAAANHAPVAGMDNSGGPSLDAALAAYWRNVPCVETATILTKVSKSEKVYCPMPQSGKYVASEILGGTVEQTVDFTGQTFDGLAAEIIFGHSGAELRGSQRVVLPAIKATITGWLLLDQFDQEDNWLTRLKLWGQLSIPNATEAKDAVVKPKFHWETLYSQFNTGRFSEGGLDLD